MIPIDVAAITGQSNDQGRAALPDVLAYGIRPLGGHLQFSNGILSPLVEPVGNASYGCHSPAFAHTWKRVTGNIVCIVPCAVGGSSVLPGVNQNGDWSPTGNWRAAAMANAIAAMSALEAAGYAPRFIGFFGVPGEADGDAINSGIAGATKEAYHDGLDELVTFLAAGIPGAKVFISRTGTEAGKPDDGFAQVRDVQEDICATNPNAFMIFRGALQFQARGLVQDDGVHYTQWGYHEKGYIGAVNAASVINGGTMRDLTPQELVWDFADGELPFEPIITASTPPHNAVIDAQGCRVHLHGDLAEVWLTARTSSLGTGGAGDVSVTLPFIIAQGFATVIGEVECRNAVYPDGTTQLCAYATDGTTSLRIGANGSNQPVKFLQWSNLKAGSQIGVHARFKIRKY